MGRRRTLDRLLSRSGLCSRTVACRLIAAGRVQVGGHVVRDPERWVDPAVEPTLLDGRPIRSARTLYLALNKPKGVVTSFGDPRGRRTVYDLIERVSAWVFPIGRLDRDSSGLLLLSNDSDFGESMTNPAFGVRKTYRVTTKRRVGEEELAELARGVELDDGPARAETVELVGHRGPSSVLLLTIAEGRNREVRRMLVAVGNRVKELKRLAIGPVELGELQSGHWRELTRAEVAGLRRTARLQPGILRRRKRARLEPGGPRKGRAP